MLYLKDEKKARLFEIIEIEETEVERAFKTILKEYDDVVSQEAHNIENCRTIEYAIRLLNEILVVGKQDH